MSENSEDKTVKAFCNECVRETNHRVLAKHEYREDFLDECGIWAQNEYLTVQCAGCDHIHFLYRSLFSEHLDLYEVRGNAPWKVTEYPPRLARPLPRWIDELDDALKTILSECYTALENGSRMLAVMGARAAFERLMMLKIDDQKRFDANVDEFVKQGYLQANLKQPLMDALEAGHAATHRGFAPTEEVLSSLFDVLEGIVNATLILPGRASDVQKVTPSRQKNTKAKEAS